MIWPWVRPVKRVVKETPATNAVVLFMKERETRQGSLGFSLR